jgi:hypothetical protein
LKCYLSLLVGMSSLMDVARGKNPGSYRAPRI